VRAAKTYEPVFIFKVLQKKAFSQEVQLLAVSVSVFIFFLKNPLIIMLENINNTQVGKSTLLITARSPAGQ
jgi:hypothetical protein